MGKTKTYAKIPPLPEFLDILGEATANCAALLQVKSRETTIPSNIRPRMRAFVKNAATLAAYWGKSKGLYGDLLEAADAKAARAGA